MAYRRKRSISFDPVLDERVEAAAAAAGLSVSAWLARCAEDRLIAEDGLRAMVEYEELFGPLSTEELAAADSETDVVDLSVAEGALRRADVVITSDPDDIAACGISAAAIRHV